MRIVDGDTVKYGGTSYRLSGIDAPENGQAAIDARGRSFDAGDAASDALSRYLVDMNGKGWQVDIVCQPGDLDRYRRQLARIELMHQDGRTLDVCAWMVAEGWAVAEYGAQYRHLEAQARRQRRGLWAGSFERPKDWRRARRGRPAAAPAAGRPVWLSLLVLVGKVALGVLLVLASASRQSRRYGHRRRRYW